MSTELEKQEKKQEESNALPTKVELALTISNKLNEESKLIITELVKESNPSKINDLSELFNINQNKKTIARIDKMSNLLDLLADQLTNRVLNRPDEMSNTEMLQTIKTASDVIEKGNKQVFSAEAAPLIQINQQDNSVNIDRLKEGLPRDSRERVKNAVLSILQGVLVNANDPIPGLEKEAEEAETIEEAEIINEEKSNE